MTEFPRWFTSSYSGNGGQCVEVATNLPRVVPVRDTKDRADGTLAFASAQWVAFVDGVKAGEFDR